MELIKVNIIRHTTGQLARHEIYKKPNGTLTGVITILTLLMCIFGLFVNGFVMFLYLTVDTHKEVK